MKKITIVGAGFSGLSLARECLKRGLAVEVFEKEDRPGGMIGTRRSADGLAETGAHSLSRTSQINRLLQELGVGVLEPSKESKKRYFYLGRLTRMPISILAATRSLAGYLWKRFRGQLKPVAGETIADWGRRVLGNQTTTNLVAPALQGIYAGDVAQMSATLVLGGLFNPRRERYKGVAGIFGGSERLIEALEADVRRRGGVIRYGAEAGPESLPTPVVLAVPPWQAARLVSGNEKLSAELARIKSAPIFAVTARFETPLELKAFGCVTGRGHGVRVLGVLLNDSIFPGRDRRPSETWIFGGATDAEITGLTDDELLRVIAHERAKIFGAKSPFVSADIVRWERGLPQYDLVLEEVLAGLVEPEGLYFHGNWLGGIGLSKILDRSEALAERLAKELA